MLKQLWCWLWVGHKKKMTRQVDYYDLEESDRPIPTMTLFDYVCTSCGYCGKTSVLPADRSNA